MIVFRYDKSFEGLLTSVFDAYVRRTFPDQLLSIGDPGPLFITDSYEVVSQKYKADRVWKSLEAKLSRISRNMMLHVWLSEVEGSDGLLFRYIRKMLDSEGRAETNFADPDVWEIKQLAHKVSHEGHYMQEFIRFQKGADGTYFAPVAPQYNALPLAVPYLKDRFADQQWLVYDTSRHYGFYYDLKTAVEVTLEDDSHLVAGKLPEEMRDNDELVFQQMWRDYLGAITIKERINPRLQRQHMPRRYWKYLTEKQ